MNTLSLTDNQRDEARKRLTRQVLSAKTLAEIQTATQALQEWIEQYPDEKEFMRDGFEQLSLMQDIVETSADR